MVSVVGATRKSRTQSRRATEARHNVVHGCAMQNNGLHLWAGPQDTVNFRLISESAGIGAGRVRFVRQCTDACTSSNGVRGRKLLANAGC